MKSYTSKIALLGEPEVGKTSLVRRFVLDKFDDKYIATIGGKVSKKVVRYLDKEITLQIWDLMGQKFQRTLSANLRGTNAIMFVGDLTRRDTFEKIEDFWISVVKEEHSKVPPFLLLANKSDLVDYNLPYMNEVRAEILYLSEKYDVNYHITSAKTGSNVETAFKEIGLLSIESSPLGYRKPSDLYKAKSLSSKEVLDLFFVQLCHELGDIEFANSVMRNLCSKLNINLASPKVEELEVLVDEIAHAESIFIESKQLEYYRRKRREQLNHVNPFRRD